MPALEQDTKYVPVRGIWDVPVTVAGKEFGVVFDSGATMAVMGYDTMTQLESVVSITRQQRHRIKFLDEVIDVTVSVLAPLLVTVAEGVQVWVTFNV